jgi:hypothetical protein
MQTENTTVMAYHTEAVYFLRKLIFETAIKLFPEYLNQINLGSALFSVSTRIAKVEELFEKKLVDFHGFNYGNAYNQTTHPESCTNIDIIYRTFL